MGNDKINILLKDWTQFQQQRLTKMKFNTVRIKTHDNEYYGNLEIIRNYIIIIPDDRNIPATTFIDDYLDGFVEVGLKAISLNQKDQRPSVILHFRTTLLSNKCIRKLRVVMGEESTSEDSANEGSSSASTD